MQMREEIARDGNAAAPAMGNRDTGNLGKYFYCHTLEMTPTATERGSRKGPRPSMIRRFS